MEKIELNVEGMMCEGCENRIKNALKQIDGVVTVDANHTQGKVMVTGNASVKTIKEKIEDIGFSVK